jgi:primase-polymerase (primpol)-like protein
MPLVIPKIKKQVEAAVMAAYQREFGDFATTSKSARSSWKKNAKIAADIAEVIIKAITTDAEVAPGIPTAGGPAAQATSAPGKIV